jgi:hypothetical protein
MVKLKTYTPEERAQRRRRTSAINERSPSTNTTEDFDESWFHDLRHQGVDIEEFLKDVIEPSFNNYDDDTASTSSEVTSVVRRMSRLSKHQQEEFMRKVTMSTKDESVRERFSSFFGQTYEYDNVTGEPVLLTAEDIEKRKWEKEKKEDSRYFEPNGTSAKDREQKRQWAIDMARKHVAEAGFEVDVEDQENAVIDCSSLDAETDMPPPPQMEPLPPVEELDLGPEPEISLGPRNIGILPPPLPHKLADLIPKLSRLDVIGITNGIVVDGTLDEGWAACDSTTMIISFHSDGTETCDTYLRCHRSASLVRCPRCNAVSPATCTTSVQLV